MSGEAVLSADRLASMREAFDRSFAEARPPDPPTSEDLLAIRLGAEPYALRLSQIAGLHVDRKITPLPGAVPAMLGLAGFRGAVVPVYDLAALFGHRAEAAGRWLAMAAGERVAFAFAALDGHLRVALDAIVPQRERENPREHVRDFARTRGLVLPVVHLPSVLAAIRRQAATNLDREQC